MPTLKGRTLTIGEGEVIEGGISVRSATIDGKKESVGFEVAGEFLPFEEFAKGVPTTPKSRGRRSLSSAQALGGFAATDRTMTRKRRLQRSITDVSGLGGASTVLG